MRWPVEQADKEGVVVYLETDLAVSPSYLLVIFFFDMLEYNEIPPC